MRFKILKKSISELTSYLNRGVTPRYVEKNGILVVNQKCIRNSKVDFSQARLHDKLKEVIPDKIVRKFDVLVNSTGVGTLGRVAQYYREEQITVDSHITIVRPDTNCINPLYFGFLMRLNESRIESLGEGSTGQTELSRSKLGELELDVIDDPQMQEKIASVLSSLDQKIWTNELINPILESISQTVFKSWFVDFDPVRAKISAIENGEDPQRTAMQIISGKSARELSQLPVQQQKSIAETADLFPSKLEQTEDGEIPKGWKWRTLYSTAEYVNGAAFKATDFSADRTGFPIVKIAELKSGITPQTKFTIKAMDSKYEINNGAMLYSWSGSPETSLEVFKWFGGKGWLNQHIFLINTESDAQKVYVFNLLRHLKPVLIEIAKNKQTTGLGHVTVADMKRIMVPYPDENGLKLIQDYLYPLYEMDSNNIIQIENLKQQRDTLIPKLLSGELQLT